MVHDLEAVRLPPPDERCLPRLPRVDGLLDNPLRDLSCLRISVLPEARTDAANWTASR